MNEEGSIEGPIAAAPVFKEVTAQETVGFDLDALVDYPAARPGPVSAGIEGRITKIP